MENLMTDDEFCEVVDFKSRKALFADAVENKTVAEKFCYESTAEKKIMKYLVVV